MVGCSVFGCKSRSERKIEGITFHTFPSNLDNKKWLDATGRENWLPTKYSKMCSIHFDDDALLYKNKRVQLKPHSVPTKFIHTDRKIPVRQFDPNTVCTLNIPGNKSLQDDIEENPHHTDKIESDSDIHTKKIYVNCLPIDSIATGNEPQARAYPVHLTTQYTDELYEFGKYVAEQLICFDVEEACLVRNEIKDLLDKHNSNKINGKVKEEQHPNVINHTTQSDTFRFAVFTIPKKPEAKTDQDSVKHTQSSSFIMSVPSVSQPVVVKASTSMTPMLHTNINSEMLNRSIEPLTAPFIHVKPEIKLETCDFEPDWTKQVGNIEGILPSGSDISDRSRESGLNTELNVNETIVKTDMNVESSRYAYSVRLSFEDTESLVKFEHFSEDETY